MVIGDQVNAITGYAHNFSTPSDSDSLSFVNALLERDDQMRALHVRRLAKFQTVMPADTAARTIQIDGRLGLAAQLRLASQIPLVS